MIIVYMATRNFYKYLEVTIKSLFATNTPSKVYILAEDDELPFKVDAEIMNVSGLKPTKGANLDTHFSYMSLLRVQLANILKEDKVLYLDVDTVVTDSLLPFWETDIEGKWWAAVRELQTWHNPFGPAYYNNGVSLYNLKQMREDGIVPVMVKELEEVRYTIAEQDVMNKFCVPDHIVEVDHRFNESHCTGFSLKPAVVHYAGINNWFNNPYVFRSEYLAKYL